MAAKQARFIASISNFDERTRINEAVANVQSVIERFVLSPFSSYSLAKVYGVQELKISIRTLDHANQTYQNNENVNPIWSLNYKKILLLFNLLMHSDFFENSMASYDEAVEFIDANPANLSSLITSLFDKYPNKSLRYINAETGMSIGLLSKLKNSSENYWKNHSIYSNTLVSLWIATKKDQ